MTSLMKDIMPKIVDDFNIRVKLFNQNPDKLDCVPACIKSVIDTAEPDNIIEIESVCKMMQTSKNRLGTQLKNLKNLNRFLEKKSVHLKFYVPEKHELSPLRIPALVKEVKDTQLPVICSVNSLALADKRCNIINPHAILLSGSQDGMHKIKYYDPLLEGVQESTTPRFIKSWSDVGKGVIFVKKYLQDRLVV